MKINIRTNMIKRIKKPKARVVWGFNPVARVVPSKKRYSRKKVKYESQNKIFEE